MEARLYWLDVRPSSSTRISDYRLPSTSDGALNNHQYSIITHVGKQYRSVQASRYMSCQNSIVGF